MPPNTIQQILLQDTAKLAETLALDVASARLEVQYLLQHVLKASRAWLLAHPEAVLSEIQQADHNALMLRRLHGEPIAYLLGEREFFGLNFKVSPATLIPRPETELLVELALQRILPHGKCRVLDLGTGSGAIALSIAHSRPAAKVLACDVSVAALDVARTNTQRLGIDNVLFMQSNWFAALDAQLFDLIVSNPPYVKKGDPHLQYGDVRFEPPFALASGDDGLRDIRHIIIHAKPYLNCGGWLLLEHGYDQAMQVRELLQQNGFGEVFSVCDLAGIERVSGGSWYK